MEIFPVEPVTRRQQKRHDRLAKQEYRRRKLDKAKEMKRTLRALNLLFKCKERRDLVGDMNLASTGGQNPDVLYLTKDGLQEGFDYRGEFPECRPVQPNVALCRKFHLRTWYLCEVLKKLKAK